MSIVDRYLNFNSNTEFLNNLGIQIDNNIITYNKYYKQYITNPNIIKNFIQEQLTDYIYKKYSQINIIGADINYYIEHINLFVKNKFRDVIIELNIDHIISLFDYSTHNKKLNYLDWRNLYYKLVYDKLLCGEFKPVKYDIKTNLLELIENNWSTINFENFINFTKTLNKIKFLNQNVDEYIILITNKFDNKDNIVKLLEYINKSFENNKNGRQISTDLVNNSYNSDDSDIVDIIGDEQSPDTSRHNFRFVIDNLKSNGYLLFEEYNKQIKIKYKKPQMIESIKKDKKTVNYFIYLVSLKDSNSVNRQVNEILLKIRDYLYDLEDSYNNNLAYQKITVKQESDKYKSIDLSSFNRSNTTFITFKYSNTNPNPVTNFAMTSQIEPYFDIYKAYYNSRYPDRQIEFDPFQSTLIVKMKFMEKNYYIHMALIQYIVLDKIFTFSDGVNLLKLSEITSIQVENLQETINSLLQIKIIKRSNAKSIEELKFYINYDFTHENNKISISSLVIKEKEEKEIKREFLHDRNTIILSNIYDYIKKNRTFTKDVLITELQYKIPFKINLEQIDSVIKTLLDKEHIILIQLQNQYGLEEIYKYVE